MSALATVLIPAWNEAAVIGRTLRMLQSGLARGQFNIVVIANACTDDTAAVARRAAPGATVLETPVAGKCMALNLGIAEAIPGLPVVCLDADLDVAATEVLALIAPLASDNSLAACGRMEVDASRSSALVRAWVRAWKLNPYFARGKFGGLFALSPLGASRVFPLPEVTADDEWIRRAFAPEEVAFIPSCHFVARAPQTLAALVATRCRSIRGARALSDMGRKAPAGSGIRPMLLAAMSQPARWADMAVYVAVMAWVRLKLATERRAPRWERDDTSRQPMAGRV